MKNPNGYCFVAGTIVATVLGFAAIETVQADDYVLAKDGDTAEVDSVQKNELDEPVLVYNFEVMDDHTYYVGEAGVLVHNQCVKPKNGCC